MQNQKVSWRREYSFYYTSFAVTHTTANTLANIYSTVEAEVPVRTKKALQLSRYISTDTDQ